MGSLFSRGLPRIKMAVSSLIFLAMIATSLADLGCNDFSYNLCHDPPADQELHVGSREECIQNCDLFGSFGKCDYLLWYGTNGPDENCKIVSGPGKSGEPGETSPQIPDYATCLTFCTMQMNSNPWIYLTYDQESQECICYDNEEVNCSLEVIIYGMTEDMVANTCK